jgi:ABC-2 type transport system ATP-binding protein
MSDPVIKASKLRVVYRPGIFRRPRTGLEGLDLEVRANEIFGYLGANGAGKTTTIKTLVGLIHADGGSAEILGRPAGDPRSRERMGYAPENPYFYEYLSAAEALDFYGRLFGLPRPERRARAEKLLDRVGLGFARDRRVRQFSKGMMQRLGLAQAMINDPEVLVLDEPMTGLDPVGRYEVRQLILEQKRAGKTVFFSSHILADVEAICDRAAVLHEARLVSCGTLSELLSSRILGVEIILGDVGAELERQLSAGAASARREGELLFLSAADEEIGGRLLREAVNGGATVKRYLPTRESLEDYFMRIRREADGSPRLRRDDDQAGTGDQQPGGQPGTRNAPAAAEPSGEDGEPGTASPEDSP